MPIKLGMRAFATLFAFIAMILFAVTISSTRLNYGGNDWVDGMPLAPVCWFDVLAVLVVAKAPIPCAF